MLLSSKQIEFVKNANHRWNFKGGATRSGKTYLDFKWIIPIRIRERIGLDGLAVILGVTKSTIERNVLEPMRNIYGDTLVGSISSDNTVNLFGEKCYALGAEKVSQVSKIRGASIKYCYGDETADWSEDVFELLKSRLDKEYSCFDGTFNPQFPQHWLKQFLDSDADIFSQTYTIDDNPFLPKPFVENLKKEYAGTVFYDRYILGKWVAAEGLVYPMFSKDRHVLKAPVETEGDYYVSSDYGIQNPNVFLLWRKERGTKRWVCLKEDYYSGRDERHQLTDSQLVDRLDAMLGGILVKRVIIDPSAASMKAELRRRGYHTQDANNTVLEGISDVCSMLGADNLAFMPCCEKTIAEFGAYLWDSNAVDRGEDAPLKESDHAMDACRYFAKTMHLVKRANDKPYTPMWG